MAVSHTYFFHDYETTGADTRRDRPMQFAGIRTDLDFNIIEEPVMFYCRLSDDVLPHPQACLITGITPQQANAEGYVEAEFMAKVHEELSRPGTCGVGYNSIRFDDEITRHGLYRNFYDPYAREWQNQCSRWDIIDMLRLTRSLRPEGIEWPSYADGSPSLRLEDLTKANGIEHGNAHDALSDVYATIGIAKLVKEKQPRLFDYVVNHRSKAKIAELIDVARMKPVLHVSSMYPVELGNAAIVAPIANHPVNKNAVVVWDLREDPTQLAELTVEEIKQRLFTPKAEQGEGRSRLPLKLLHLNKCPIVAPAGMLNTEEAARLKIQGDVCRTHLACLRNMTDVMDRVKAAFEPEKGQQANDPDLMLYDGGFLGPEDKQATQDIREADPEALYELSPAFQDPRLEEMFLRYKARNYPDTLLPEQRMVWEEFRKARLLGQDGTGHLSFEGYSSALEQAYNNPELTETQRYILDELVSYGQSIYPTDDFDY